MRDSQARTTYLKDYRPPPFTIETTDLEFNLYEDYVLVVAKLLIKPSDGSGEPAPNALTLQGHEIELRSLLISFLRMMTPSSFPDYPICWKNLNSSSLSKFIRV